ncbi:MAG: 4'-phosphopantetheinyl transferase superfamily protein [Candidatus Symbiodolus clandestinus]
MKNCVYMHLAESTDYCISQFPESNKFITNVKFLPPPVFANLSILQCNYSVKHYSNELFSQLGISCPRPLLNVTPKRKAEFLAGRYLCRLLLLVYGLPPLDITIGTNRQPLWPVGWIGSITHTHNTAISCLANLSQISLLGIDLEEWIEENTANEISKRIIDEKELMLLSPLGTHQQKVTLAFSAKESFFKAIYLKVVYYFDFNVVRLVNVTITNYRFTLQLKKNLSCSAKEGDLFFGYFNTNEKRVLTFVMKKC